MKDFVVTINPVIIGLLTVWQTVMLILGAFDVVNALWLVLLPVIIMGGITLALYVCVQVLRLFR